MFLLWPLIVSVSFKISFGSELVTFWHITDFHLDLNYSDIGDVRFNCHFNTENSTNMPQFGFSTSVDCDTPYLLAQSAIKAMRDINGQPDFIIWTGDSAPHLDDKDVNDEWVISTLGSLTSLFYTYFPTTKLYSVLGNHDYWPTNQFPTTTNLIYQSAADLWGKYLSPDARMNLSQFGYYRQDLDRPANTILLGLNTNLNYKRNRNTTDSQDPAGQFAFVESSLNEAKLNGKKVMIISHIPPGIYWSLNDTINDLFVHLLAQYADIIIGSHFGHNHVDQMMLIRNDSDDNFVGWLLVAPAVNTWLGYGRNPAIRQISIDSETGDIRQLKQFWLNLTDVNLNGNDKWLEHYTISIPEGKPFLQYVVDYYNQLKLGGDEKLSELLKRENVMSNNLACDSGCRKQHLCGMSEVNRGRFVDCYRSKGSISRVSCFTTSLPLLLIAMLCVFVAW